jgi:hypothetical protein
MLEKNSPITTESIPEENDGLESFNNIKPDILEIREESVSEKHPAHRNRYYRKY